MDHRRYDKGLRRHYAGVWGPPSASHRWEQGRSLPQPCTILEYAPTDRTFRWIYATAAMTPLSEPSLLELFLISPRQTDDHVELLTAIAHYHQTSPRLGLGHTVNFGRPWLDASRCSYGLISLPYPFGPVLENAVIEDRPVRLLWLVPITAEERAYKVAHGIEALEDQFERQQFNYLDPARRSVVDGEAGARG